MTVAVSVGKRSDYLDIICNIGLSRFGRCYFWGGIGELPEELGKSRFG